MDETLYQPVAESKEACLHNEGPRKEYSYKPLLRQIIVCSGIWNSFFITGLCLGAPTVVIAQIRREANSTEVISDEMASWISSVYGYAALPWFILPVISAKIGRKYPFYMISIIALVSYIVFYFSTTPIHILIAEILQAPQFACQITVSIIIVTEYTSPKYRGLFLTLKSASMNWGMWVANALGTFFHWRTIAVAGIVCASYNLLTTLYWCESPSWLASKHRYEECAKAHRWIKGEDAESEKELEALIRSCKEYQEEQDRKNFRNEENSPHYKNRCSYCCNKCVCHPIFKRAYRTLLEKAFYRPIILSIGVLSLYHTSGKLVCSVYAIGIIKHITNSVSTAYFGMLLLDGVTVIGMYIGSGLSKYVKRRTLLMTGSCGGIFFLFVLALYLFLVKSAVFDENKYVSLALLTLFFLFISIGPIILSTSIYGELMPLRYRCAGMLITGIWTQSILGSTTLKTAPLVFRSFGLDGAFLFYGTMSSVIIYFLYKYLPETKDKTMQEIEENLVGDLRRDNFAESQPINS